METACENVFDKELTKPRVCKNAIMTLNRQYNASNGHGVIRSFSVLYGYPAEKDDLRFLHNIWHPAHGALRH